MKNTVWHKRIPTLLGLLLILAGIGATTYLVKTGSPITTIAGPSENPQNIRVTNITNDSFIVTYITEAQVIGSVNYGKDQSLGQTTLDDRDKNGSISEYITHYITIKNLEPATDYYFSITSGSNEYKKENDELYKITTGPDIGKPITEDNLINGTVIFPEGSINEAVIYITSQDANTISSIVDENGKYSILLDRLRSNDLSTFFDFNENTKFEMLVQGQSTSSDVIFTLPLNNELAPVVLSENFDFTQEDLSEEEIQSEKNFSTITSKGLGGGGEEPQITNPNENQTFIDYRPKFTGTSLPNSTVSIEIDSDENIKAQVITDARGNWSYRPPSDLSYGDHTITIKTKDSSGIVRTIMRSFTIFASGSQVTESATPSASPIPTIPPEITSSPTPIPISTLPPTQTPTPFATPTVTPVPPSSISPTIPPPISPPGISFTLLGIIGIGITGFGTLILLYNRNTSI